LGRISSMASSDLKESENSKFPKEKIRIIDLGCGSSRNMIVGDNLEYYGIDISLNQLKAAKKHVKEKGINAKFFKFSADNLDKSIFKNEMFDYGLFIATLHCIEDEKERLNALYEFYRVLKKGAIGIITVWNSEDSRFNGLIGDTYMSWKKDGKEYYRYYYLYNKDELMNLLKSIGFKIIQINDKQTSNKLMTKSLRDRFSKKNLIIMVKKD